MSVSMCVCVCVCVCVQVMTKIAVLEEERLKLLETVDQIQSDNQRVRGGG